MKGYITTVQAEVAVEEHQLFLGFLRLVEIRAVWDQMAMVMVMAVTVVYPLIQLVTMAVRAAMALEVAAGAVVMLTTIILRLLVVQVVAPQEVMAVMLLTPLLVILAAMVLMVMVAAEAEAVKFQTLMEVRAVLAAAAVSFWKWSIKMRYLIVEDNKIANIIESEANFAESVGAMPEYSGVTIGQTYAPPQKTDPLATLAEAVADLMYEADKKSIGG